MIIKVVITFYIVLVIIWLTVTYFRAKMLKFSRSLYESRLDRAL